MLVVAYLCQGYLEKYIQIISGYFIIKHKQIGSIWELLEKAVYKQFWFI